MPVTNKLTDMELSRRFSSRDNRTLIKGPGEYQSVVFIREH